MKMRFKKAKMLLGICHPYEKLNMGFINAYSMIIPKTDLLTYVKAGWIERKRFRNFHYAPKRNETVLLSKPFTLKDRGIDYLIGKVIETHDILGTYGMGSPGFAGFAIREETEHASYQYLVYATNHADGYIIFDGRPLTGVNACSPWIPEESDKDFDNWMTNHQNSLPKYED